MEFFYSMKDIYIEQIKNIRPHPNADRLEIGYINGWQVCIPKGVWNDGDYGVYIAPDTVVERNELTEHLFTFLPSNGRIKPMKARGEESNGLFIRLTEGMLKTVIKGQVVTEPNKEVTNQLIYKLLPAIANYSERLANGIGIRHYVNPQTVANERGSNSNAIGGLPFGLSKTDEENWESMKESDIPFNEKVLLTKKMDGCSATFIATPEGTYHICSRSQELAPDSKTHFVEVGERYRDLLLDYAKKHNKTIVIRGEITGKNIQKGKFNNEALNDEYDFWLFRTMFPMEPNPDDRLGYHGTSSHFLIVNKELGLKTAPIMSEEILTRELLEELQQRKAELGEGVVINHRNGSFKAKSLDYDRRN